MRQADHGWLLARYATFPSKQIMALYETFSDQFLKA
jgi:hypothetical protein